MKFVKVGNVYINPFNVVAVEQDDADVIIYRSFIAHDCIRITNQTADDVINSLAGAIDMT